MNCLCLDFCLEGPMAPDSSIYSICFFAVLVHLSFNFKKTIFVWSEIVPRLIWLEDEICKPLERVRKKVNVAISKFCKLKGIISYRHVVISRSKDG
ncbi:hypothetical protein XENTR_v10016492 [Xenopus tropicalis]|nr:hypothetical protein XENTR_v10016492 [Xenopus tropicalis]